MNTSTTNILNQEERRELLIQAILIIAIFSIAITVTILLINFNFIPKN